MNTPHCIIVSIIAALIYTSVLLTLYDKTIPLNDKIIVGTMCGIGIICTSTMICIIIDWIDEKRNQMVYMVDEEVKSYSQRRKN